MAVDAMRAEKNKISTRTKASVHASRATRTGQRDENDAHRELLLCRFRRALLTFLRFFACLSGSDGRTLAMSNADVGRDAKR
jgi:hypothetical protein